MKNTEPISAHDAQNAVLNATISGPSCKIRLNNATGHILSVDIKSPIHSPPFNNSAMDGYGFKFADYKNGKPLGIKGESSAGKSLSSKLEKGNAVRIFTGADIPKGVDTVVMQEKVIVKGNQLFIKDLLLRKGANIRSKGSQLRKGEIALRKGSVIFPATIGFLSSLGITEVSVFCKPSVTIIVTGSELVSPGKTTGAGKIFESNSSALSSALEKEGIKNIKILKVKDNFLNTLSAFRKAVSGSDIIICTGGISVGDYDFTGQVFQEENVAKVFYKVKQKPGKPLYFGKKNKKYIFGLPGNPASVLTCFYEYVLPCIRKIQNHPNITLPTLNCRLVNEFNKKNGLTVFLKGFTDLVNVTVLEGQQSYIMKSFAEANCFVVADEKTSGLKPGSKVTIHLLGDL